MAELKPCPFCGGDAEIYTGRTFPSPRKAMCKTVQEALERLEEYKSSGVVIHHTIREREYRTVAMKKGVTKVAVAAEMQAFIPRCCNEKCLGRTQIMFHTELEAIEAWNRRHNNGC